jgi:hypothetical protein
LNPHLKSSFEPDLYFLSSGNKKDHTDVFKSALYSWMPEEFLGGGTAIRALLNTSVWSFLFPELKKYRSGSKLDFRCGFNKDYLIEG